MKYLIKIILSTLSLALLVPNLKADIYQLKHPNPIWNYVIKNPKKAVKTVGQSMLLIVLIKSAYDYKQNLTIQKSSKKIIHKKARQRRSSQNKLNTKINQKVIDSQIIEIVDELLDITKNPHKSFAEYASQIIEITTNQPRYKETRKLLINAKDIKSCFQLKSALYNLEETLPKPLGDEVSCKLNNLGFFQQIKLVNTRLK